MTFPIVGNSEDTWGGDLRGWGLKEHNADGTHGVQDDIITKSPWIDVRAFGAKLDGTTDDTVAIQAAIDSIGDTEKIRPGIVLIPGPTVISDTILLERKSIWLLGRGWGSSIAGGDYIKWIGAAGSPMLRLHRCWGSRVTGFRFIGDSTAKPSSAISMYQLSTDGNPNFKNRLEHIWVGSLGNFDSDNVIQFDIGIVFEGDNNNNSENSGDNIHITQCATGIDIQNFQHGNNNFTNLNISQCGTGFKTKARVIGTNWFFDNSSVVDLHTIGGGDASFSIRHFASELAARMIMLEFGTKLFIEGGSFQYSANLTDAKMINGHTNGPGTVSLKNFKFANASGGDAYVGTPLIVLKEDGGGNTQKYLLLESVSGLAAAHIDMTSSVATNFRYFRVENWKPNGVWDGGTELPTCRNLIDGIGSIDVLRYDIPSALVGGTGTLADDATPSVAGGNTWLTGGTTTITDFDDGIKGQVITVLCKHSLTFDFTTAQDADHNLDGSSADITADTGDILRFLCEDGTKWQLISNNDASVDNN